MRVRIIPRPNMTGESYLTQLLWTDRGMIDLHKRIIRQMSSTDGILSFSYAPFTGSVSKVYHSEPATITVYSKTLWREETPGSDVTYERF